MLEGSESIPEELLFCLSAAFFAFRQYLASCSSEVGSSCELALYSSNILIISLLALAMRSQSSSSESSSSSWYFMLERDPLVGVRITHASRGGDNKRILITICIVRTVGSGRPESLGVMR